MADISLLEISGRIPKVGSMNWVTKINNVLSESTTEDTVESKINEIAVKVNEIYGDNTGFDSKLDKDGYAGTAQDLKDEIDAISSGTGVQLQIHLDDLNNPHQVTKSQLGLTDVDNTSDLNKPISSATQSALDNKVDKILGKGLSTNDLTDTLLTSINGAITSSGYIVYTGDGKSFLSNNGTYIDLTTLDGGNASTIF